MRTIVAFLVGGVAVLGAPVAQAADPGKLDTTADLLAYCDTSSGPGETAATGESFCNGFIAGTGLFYLELVRAKAIEPLACKDPTPPLAEVRAAFVSWARANPQYLDSKPVDGFWRAMAATYPCPK
jgi:hypothetical protein